MKQLFLIIAILSLHGCNRPEGEMIMEVADEETFEDLLSIPISEQPPPPPSITSGTEQISKKTIKTGGINFQSQDIVEDYQTIRELLPRYDAYIEHENQSRTKERISYQLTIRVPSTVYDSLFVTFSTIGHRLENKYSSIKDVTENYYDLSTRIKNDKLLEKRYLKILESATEIKDILEIENKLNQIRTDIENLQGQFNYLSKQVSLSTISLSFYEELPYVYDASQRGGFLAKIFSAINNGWQGFLNFVIGLIAFWPFLILLIVLGYFIKKFRSQKN
ncbi:DUF4349 domain-containing protein [Cyclobacterium marinum]|uniref:DUF4349 domain-containing protein n=1 Tax=Cyclobacterium marinum (strain ATCC 25205 / DSM 745 / LMG 13164 / NCIMB 1802) TaxID=880070 RepID=G0IVZ9_CYCMS|nr:DUF4349 domain-containing protein [Cyclobacterium marinum]AEL25544.1 hypothetical protein Cycma_1791 [Cyclobacterium marinum DSM 745]